MVELKKIWEIVANKIKLILVHEANIERSRGSMDFPYANWVPNLEAVWPKVTILKNNHSKNIIKNKIKKIVKT